MVQNPNLHWGRLLSFAVWLWHNTCSSCHIVTPQMHLLALRKHPRIQSSPHSLPIYQYYFFFTFCMDNRTILTPYATYSRTHAHTNSMKIRHYARRRRRRRTPNTINFACDNISGVSGFECQGYRFTVCFLVKWQDLSHTRQTICYALCVI